MIFWIGVAEAACQLSQTRGPDRIELEIQVEGAAEPCRHLELQSTEPITLTAWVDDGFRHRLPPSQLAQKPGGGWDLAAPQLDHQESLLVLVQFPQGVEGREPELRIGLGTPLPPLPSAVQQVHQIMTLNVDPKHPGWGFADPSRGFTEVEQRWLLLPGAAPELLSIPVEAEILELSGASSLPGALLSEGDEVYARYRLGGQQAQGDILLPPGSLLLKGPVQWRLSTTAKVTQTTDGTLIESETGDRLAWRVEKAGDQQVIPDLPTFLAGLTERFRLASLPEPAEPMWLRPEEDPEFLWSTLYGLVRDLPDFRIGDPLSIQHLNRAWKRRAASPVEKGLILHRLLAQERIGALWGLTGSRVNLESYTGFDTTILETALGWLDPSCAACAPGEISTSLLGQPLLMADGVLQSVPRLPGHFKEQISLKESTFEVEIWAEGQAALWLREATVGADPEGVPARLLASLDMQQATILEMEGVEKRGRAIHLRLQSPRTPPLRWPEGRPWSEAEAEKAGEEGNPRPAEGAAAGYQGAQ